MDQSAKAVLHDAAIGWLPSCQGGQFPTELGPVGNLAARQTTETCFVAGDLNEAAESVSLLPR